ncbi:MAG: septum site-determining protein MinC [Chloroflexaceae bacterium]
MSDLISIKGGRDGLQMRLDDTAEWTTLLTQLEHRLTQNQSFFSGARLTVDVGDRALSAEQLAAMLELMQQHGVQADALAARARESRNAARAAGLTARPLPRYPEPAAAGGAGDSPALFLARTVRSGQVVRHSGHVTLIGDVNPGGEIIAGGSVVVWGRMRGFVHAGALGDASAVVCAIELAPTQLRIADQIAAGSREAPRTPEIARIEGGQIVVAPWEALKR